VPEPEPADLCYGGSGLSRAAVVAAGRQANGMSRPPRVLVAGAFGQDNPGDEWVPTAFLDALHGCDVTATVYRSGATSGRLVCVQCASRIVWPSPALPSRRISWS